VLAGHTAMDFRHGWKCTGHVVRGAAISRMAGFCRAGGCVDVGEKFGPSGVFGVWGGVSKWSEIDDDDDSMRFDEMR